MKLITALLSASLLLASFSVYDDFLAEQKKYARVRTAIAEKESGVRQKLAGNGIALSELNILLVAYKGSDELELYVKKKTESTYSLMANYEICARSGRLGPKRREGDYQVPEGFYHINYFNPTSNFYLSLGINYPNTADRRKTSAPKPGGNIFIHGSCVTIGCIPMTDEIIKEIYVYALHAKNNGQSQIPVYIFPFRMTAQNFARYSAGFYEDQPLIDFWTNLKVGHDRFMSSKEKLNFTVAANGDYVF